MDIGWIHNVHHLMPILWGIDQAHLCKTLYINMQTRFVNMETKDHNMCYCTYVLTSKRLGFTYWMVMTIGWSKLNKQGMFVAKQATSTNFAWTTNYFHHTQWFHMMFVGGLCLSKFPVRHINSCMKHVKTSWNVLQCRSDNFLILIWA